MIMLRLEIEIEKEAILGKWSVLEISNKIHMKSSHNFNEVELSQNFFYIYIYIKQKSNKLIPYAW